jgi:hypothetical protein
VLVQDTIERDGHPTPPQQSTQRTRDLGRILGTRKRGDVLHVLPLCSTLACSTLSLGRARRRPLMLS